MTETSSDSEVPHRLDVRAVPGAMSRQLADQAAALMVLPLLVEIDRAANPTTPVGRLVMARLRTCGVADLVAFVRAEWSSLERAPEWVALEVLEVVNDWADHLMGEAMTAARIKGGSCDGMAA